MEKNLQKRRFNIYLTLSLVFFALFLITLILVLTVDVKKVGVNETKIGLATINTKIFSKLGTNKFWFKFTNFMGYFSIVIIAAFALLGVIELIKRRSIKAVDRDLIIMGLMFVMLILIYILFEIIHINYRPILIDGEIEASFPSSHTMLIVSVLGIVSVKCGYSVSNKNFKWSAISFNTALSVLSVIGRLLSGVHWFSDIVAAVFISLFIIFLFKALILKFNNKD